MPFDSIKQMFGMQDAPEVKTLAENRIQEETNDRIKNLLDKSQVRDPRESSILGLQKYISDINKSKQGPVIGGVGKEPLPMQEALAEDAWGKVGPTDFFPRFTQSMEQKGIKPHIGSVPESNQSGLYDKENKDIYLNTGQPNPGATAFHENFHANTHSQPLNITEFQGNPREDYQESGYSHFKGQNPDMQLMNAITALSKRANLPLPSYMEDTSISKQVQDVYKPTVDSKNPRLDRLKNILENYGEYSTPYKTELSPEQETGFRNWVEENRIPFKDSIKNDYDMRGFYQSGQVPQINEQDQLPHFTDKFKTPFHKTFSNESQYATPDAPHWDNNLLRSPSGEVQKLELDKELLDPRVEALKKLKNGLRAATEPGTMGSIGGGSRIG